MTMKNQQIFDKVCNHLIKQGRIASMHGNCKYRTNTGLKCALGCLIPKKKYDTKIEGFTLQSEECSQSLLPGHQKLVEILKSENISTRSFPLLKSLQDVHDGSQNRLRGNDNRFNIPVLKKDLRRIAKKFWLKQPNCIKK